MIAQAKAGQIALHDRWFRYHMPYALQRLDDKTWLPLNRNYKPLGCLLKTHVEYDDYRAQAMRFATDPRTFKDIWTAEKDDICSYITMVQIHGRTTSIAWVASSPIRSKSRQCRKAWR